MHFLLCPKQGNKIEGVVLDRVCILGFFCPKQCKGGFKPLAANLYPNISQVPPGTVTSTICITMVKITSLSTDVTFSLLFENLTAREQAVPREFYFHKRVRRLRENRGSVHRFGNNISFPSCSLGDNRLSGQSHPNWSGRLPVSLALLHALRNFYLKEVRVKIRHAKK